MSCQSNFKAQEAQLATGVVDTTMHCTASPTATESLQCLLDGREMKTSGVLTWVNCIMIGGWVSHLHPMYALNFRTNSTKSHNED